MKAERVCDIFARMFAEIGTDTSAKREHRFINGPGCGRATGREGAHVAFLDTLGKPVAVTITPSMIELYRWQYSVQRETGSGEHDSLLLERGALEDAIALIWAHHRVTR